MADSGTAGRDPYRGDGFAYLLVQLGFHLAGKFAERLAPLGLEPRHFGMLTRLAANEGRSQQASARHAEEVGASLTATQRGQLTDLLRRLADEQGITGASLPGPPSGVR